MKFRYAIVLVAFLTACGGGGGSSTNSFVPSGTPTPGSGSGTSTSGGAGTVAFTFTVPSSTSSTSTVKRPAYVSPNTGSIAISLQSVNGTTPTTSSAPTIAAVGASATGCATSSSGLKCTVTVSAPAGNDVFSISTYQSSNGSGAVLASTAIAANVGATAAAVTLSLGGVPASVSFSPARLPLINDGNIHRVPVVINAADASGATIVGAGAYQSPVSLQVQNDPAGALSLSTASVSQPGTVVTVTYNSAKPLTDASIVATDNAMASATLVAAPLVINPSTVTLFDGTPSGVTITEAGFTGSFAVSVGNAADATVTVAPGTLGSGTAVATVTPKVNFDVTTLNVSDGNFTAQVPLNIVPQNNAYSAYGPAHTMIKAINMVEGPGGLLWSGDMGTGNLVSFNPTTGAYATYNVDPSLQGPQGIAFDANGNLWFADGSQIGEFNTTTGAVTATYSTGFTATNPVVTAIIQGPSGSGTMWFYDADTYSSSVSGGATYVGSINTSTGAITEYSANGAGPLVGNMSMVLATDGSIWFADQYHYSMGHINTSTGAITEYKISYPAYPQESPMSLAVAPDGKIWFVAQGTTSGTSIAGSVDPSNSNAIAYYAGFPQSGNFSSLETGSDGYLWFVYDPSLDGGLEIDSYSNLGVINPATGATYLYPSFLPQYATIASVVDRGDGTLWLLDSGFGEIGKVTFK